MTNQKGLTFRTVFCLTKILFLNFQIKVIFTFTVELYTGNNFHQKLNHWQLVFEKSDRFINKRGRNAQKLAVLLTSQGHEDEITPIDGSE